MKETRKCNTCGIEYPKDEFKVSGARKLQCRLCYNKAHVVYGAKYRASHREQCRERNKNWIINNPDKMKKCRSDWLARHPGYNLSVMTKWYYVNHDICLEQAREWRKSHSETMKDGRVRKAYGMTPEEHDRLFVKQDGRCAICDIDACELKKSLQVDHNHKTGKVRSLLCENCNHLIGNARENIDILSGAIGYLRNFSIED